MKNHETEHIPSPAPDDPDGPSSVEPRAKLVLVVDDEPRIQKLLAKILNSQGHQALVSMDAATARELLASQPIDLILCDLMMPGESGESLIQFVALDYPDVGVVVVTGVAEPKVAERILGLGVLGYLIKPFDKNQVIITIANALRLNELERQERIRRRALERNLEEQKRAWNHLHEASLENQRHLRGKETALRDATGTVRLLLNQRSEDRTEFESDILETVRKTVHPYLQRLKGTHLSQGQIHYVETLEANLERIISPFVKSLASPYLNLTPVELQVADLIRQGRSTKRIAAILNLSPNTVMTHRYHLREKLGLKKRRISLSAYLKTLEYQKT